MSDRVPCVVPFCRCTRRPGPHNEWICGKHWRLVSKTLKRRKAKLARWYRRRFGNAAHWTFPAGSPKRIEAARLDRLEWQNWEACKRQVIERAGGIGWGATPNGYPKTTVDF